MCGRYSLTTPVEGIIRLFDVPERPNFPPRYNIAPTQEVAAVRQDDDGSRHLVFFRWGLVPFWANDLSIGARMINARAESVRQKPAFRAAFKRRRCLVAADGYYEWKKEKTAKQPYRIVMEDGGPYAFAGLWESWSAPDGSEVETCTIVTTDASPSVAHIHNRMPVIVDQEDFATWLDGGDDDAERLLRPYAGSRTLSAYPVDRRVGNVRYDDVDLVAPLPEPEEGTTPDQPRLV